MRTSPTPSPFTLPRVGFVLLCLILATVVVWANVRLDKLQANNSAPNLPFGVFLLPDGTLLTQDFSYNLLFLQGVREKLVPHPYRLDDQVDMMRRTLPQSQSGMSHGYSPVAFVLAQPLLALSGQGAYVAYTILGAVGLLLLYYFCLMPLMETRLQVYTFLICMLSVCVVTAVVGGQTVLITTAMLGGVWYLLKIRTGARSLWSDVLIATLFWALCMKPNVALIPFALLVGEKAWRPLAMTALMLLATWLSVANFYGGIWTGLADYSYLLNHYNNAEFPAYLQRGAETPESARIVMRLFQLDRSVVLATCVLLVALRWTRQITPSQMFQGMVWNFLLFSPYVLGSESCIVCLLVVEGAFFRSTQPLVAVAKLVLIAALLNLRGGVTFPIDVGLVLKWMLFCWIVAEGLPRRFAARSTAAREPERALAT